MRASSSGRWAMRGQGTRVLGIVERASALDGWEEKVRSEVDA